MCMLACVCVSMPRVIICLTLVPSSPNNKEFTCPLSLQTQWLHHASHNWAVITLIIASGNGADGKLCVCLRRKTYTWMSVQLNNWRLIVMLI